MRTLLFPLLLLLLWSGTAAAAAPTPKEFAFGVRLTTSGSEGLQEVPVPVDIYRRSIRPGLSDVCVFNGDGEPVPFALIHPAPVPAEPERRPLPLFPVPRSRGGSAPDIRLHLRVDASGAVVDVRTGRNGPLTESGSAPAYYVLDASKIDGPLSGLDLAWTAGEGNYLGSARLEVSDDLQQWAEHASGSVASLRAAGEELSRHGIEFPQTKKKYYRLTLTPEAGVPRVTSATARLAPVAADPPRDRLVLRGRLQEGEGAGYLFDSGGSMPIDRLRLRFQQENNIIRGAFYSRSDKNGEWRLRQRALVYRLRQGGTVLQSGDVEIPPCEDRYWLLKVDRKGALGEAAPELEVAWLPHRVDFIARGRAPFLLAYGSAHPGCSGLRDDTILDALRDSQRKKLTPAAARAGTPEALGGKGALRPSFSTADWKTASLWGLLVLAVVVLAAFAIRLYREMSGGKQ